MSVKIILCFDYNIISVLLQEKGYIGLIHEKEEGWTGFSEGKANIVTEPS